MSTSVSESAALKKKRAPKITAPGARRIKFTGIMAVPDEYGRLRILLIDRTADGHIDPSLYELRKAIPNRGPGFSLPYEVKKDDDDVRAVATVTVPARYKKHWGSVAEGLRGLEVLVEVTIRPFTLPGEALGEQLSGEALDLSMLGPRPTAAARA